MQANDTASIYNHEHRSAAVVSDVSLQPDLTSARDGVNGLSPEQRLLPAQMVLRFGS